VGYSKINKKDFNHFVKILGEENILYKKGLEEFSKDHTEDLKYLPEIVLFPKNTNQVSSVVKYCNNKLIPITPSAALTGLSGGALPFHGGVSLSLKKMNKIIDVNPKNFQAIIEPGLINEEFQNEIEKHGLFYPPDPASKGSCTIGGNISLNAGGPRAVKYGVTSNFVRREVSAGLVRQRRRQHNKNAERMHAPAHATTSLLFRLAWHACLCSRGVPTTLPLTWFC